jgi:hypothetical protein
MLNEMGTRMRNTQPSPEALLTAMVPFSRRKASRTSSRPIPPANHIRLPRRMSRRLEET